MDMVTIGNCRFYHGDCMKLMAETPDKFFYLAIVDPPYGINVSRKISGSGKSKSINGKNTTITNHKNGKAEKWDSEPPPQEYFAELFRVSKYQIIWGGNYFMDKIKMPSKCWIGLVKAYIADTFSFSNIEFAYTNLNAVSRYFRQDNKIGNIGSVPTQEERFHPTQKSVPLYKWLLHTYAQPGWKILDTHGGSFSSAIAAYEGGYQYTGIEIDKDYFDKAVKRLRDIAAHPFLIEPSAPKTELVTLFDKI